MEIANDTLRLRLTPEVAARLTGEADARRMRGDGLTERCLALSRAMMMVGNRSEAYLLRRDTADNGIGTELWYREMQGRIPPGWEITVTGTLPRQIGLCRVVPALFSTPVTSETRFPISPPTPRWDQWTMGDYIGHLGSHVVPKDLGGAGGGKYPGLIDAGHDCRAILDGIHYLVQTPWSPEAVPVLRQLPGSRWDRRARSWIVKKRWHRLIGLALGEIAYLEQDRLEHLWGLARDMGTRLDNYRWAREIEAGAWSITLPDAPVTAALTDLIRSLNGRRDGRCVIVPRRYAPNLSLIAREIDAELSVMTSRRDAEISAAEAARQSRAVADVRAREAEAEQRRWRQIYPVETCPVVGDLITLRGQQRRVVQLGQPFGGETVPSVRGPVVTPRTRYVYTAPVDNEVRK